MQNITYLSNILLDTTVFVYTQYIIPWINQCRRYKSKYVISDFYPLCRVGNLPAVKELYTLYQGELNLNLALGEAVNGNQVNVSRFLIESGANNLDDCLKVACANNHYELVELFIQKGASILIGKRMTRSTNILRMIYRYEQKSELIN